MIYNIDPKRWGKHFWKTIHYITLSAPINPSKEYKQHILNFFESLKFLLPCENCRYHYSSYLIKNPLTDDILTSRILLINWAIDLHNSVNIRTGKKILSIEEVNQIYLKEENNYNYKSIVTICLLILLIVILVYYIKFR